jgi:hypothetical protein
MERAKEGNYDAVVSHHKVINVEKCFKRDRPCVVRLVDNKDTSLLQIFGSMFENKTLKLTKDAISFVLEEIGTSQS